MPAPLAYRAILDSIIVSFPGTLATAAFWRATGSVSRLQQASVLSPVRALSDGPNGGVADSLDEAKAALRAAGDAAGSPLSAGLGRLWVKIIHKRAAALIAPLRQSWPS